MTSRASTVTGSGPPCNVIDVERAANRAQRGRRLRPAPARGGARAPAPASGRAAFAARGRSGGSRPAPALPPRLRGRAGRGGLSGAAGRGVAGGAAAVAAGAVRDRVGRAPHRRASAGLADRAERPTAVPRHARSEEHTSELQSRPHLVCRLLLEKKK